MTIDWNEVAKGAVGLILAVAVGWASWLSIEVVNIKTSQASLHEKFGSLDARITSVDARITRISNKLPTEIALHTQEFYARPLERAVITAKAFFESGQWTRRISIYDNEQKLLATFSIPVNSPTDHAWLRGLLWKVAAYDDQSIEISKLDRYRQRFDVNAPQTPEFIDMDHSLLSSKSFEEIRTEISNTILQRSSMPRNPTITRISTTTESYADLTAELKKHANAVYKP